MLTINADDWGLRPDITDAILECWGYGAITCCSAMVHMEDSARAAALAKSARLPLGLHVNLTTEFTDAKAPYAVRERQREAAAYFARAGWRRFIFDPLRSRSLDACIVDQIDEFQRLYGAEPIHADGHQHVQIYPTVLGARALGRVRSLRRSETFKRGERPFANRAYRRLINGWIAHRFDSPARFVSIRDIHPDLGGVGIEGVVADAAHEDVEVMVHPGMHDERRVLLSAGWLDLVEGASTGCKPPRLISPGGKG